MTRPLLVAVFSLSAAAVSLPALSAGTNEISSGDAPAYGMTGTGSNAMDTRPSPSTGASGVVVPAPAPSVAVPANEAAVANGTTVVVPANPGTAVVVPPNATVVYPANQVSNRVPDPRVNLDAAAAVNFGAVGGESAGKSSDSPGW